MSTTWPESIYELELGTGLAVCVAHRGEHAHYNGGCQALPPRRPPSTLPSCRQDPSCRQAEGSHVHAPPTRVELDPELLAEAAMAIVRRVAASGPRPSTWRPPLDPMVPPPESTAGERPITGVQIVSADDPE